MMTPPSLWICSPPMSDRMSLFYKKVCLTCCEFLNVWLIQQRYPLTLYTVQYRQSFRKKKIISSWTNRNTHVLLLPVYAPHGHLQLSKASLVSSMANLHGNLLALFWKECSIEDSIPDSSGWFPSKCSTNLPGLSYTLPHDVDGHWYCKLKRDIL